MAVAMWRQITPAHGCHSNSWTKKGGLRENMRLGAHGVETKQDYETTLLFLDTQWDKMPWELLYLVSIFSHSLLEPIAQLKIKPNRTHKSELVIV